MWWIKFTQRSKEINDELINPELPLEKMIALQKELAEFADLLPIALKAEEVNSDLDFLQQMLTEATSDQERHEIREQIRSMEDELEKLENDFKEVRKPQASHSKIIVEIRPGTGGQEASLFGALLVEMYKKYAQHNNLEFEVLSFDYNDVGGVENVSFALAGMNAYYLMQHESGVHRVQRIPKTESNGRIHTSTATVAVLLEPEEAVVDIDENYLRVDVFRASGAGGQHVNKTESAIRLTYEHPDFEKVVISMQDERSQHKNKAKAMKILKAKIYNQAQTKLSRGIADARKSQVGTGERFEKIRTYNFPQSRVTDHRSGMSVYNMQDESLLLPKDLLAMIEAILD